MALVGSNDPWYLQSVSNLDISNCGLRSEITWVVKKKDYHLHCRSQFRKTFYHQKSVVNLLFLIQMGMKSSSLTFSQTAQAKHNSEDFCLASIELWDRYFWKPLIYQMLL